MVMPISGPALRRVRQAKFLSQRILAKEAGVDHSTIYRLERGGQQATLTTIQKLATALGVEPGELVIRD